MGSGGGFRICVFAMFCEKSMENLFGELRCVQEVSCEGVRALREGAKLLGEVCVKIGVEGLEPRWGAKLLEDGELRRARLLFGEPRFHGTRSFVLTWGTAPGFGYILSN